MTRKYRDVTSQRLYDAMRKAFADPASELYLPDGSQRTGAGHRCAFWDGYNGKPRSPHAPLRTLASVCYAAGKDCAAEVERIA